MMHTLILHNSIEQAQDMLRLHALIVLFGKFIISTYFTISAGFASRGSARKGCPKGVGLGFKVLSCLLAGSAGPTLGPFLVQFGLLFRLLRHSDLLLSGHSAAECFNDISGDIHKIGEHSTTEPFIYR